LCACVCVHVHRGLNQKENVHVHILLAVLPVCLLTLFDLLLVRVLLVSSCLLCVSVCGVMLCACLYVARIIYVLPRNKKEG